MGAVNFTSPMGCNPTTTVLSLARMTRDIFVSPQLLIEAGIITKEPKPAAQASRQTRETPDWVQQPHAAKAALDDLRRGNATRQRPGGGVERDEAPRPQHDRYRLVTQDDQRGGPGRAGGTSARAQATEALSMLGIPLSDRRLAEWAPELERHEIHLVQLYQHEQYQDAIDYLFPIWRDIQDRFEHQSLPEAIIFSMLAYPYFQLNTPTSRATGTRFYEDAFTILNRHYDPSSFVHCNLHLNFATYYANVGMFREAQDALQRAQPCWERCSDPAQLRRFRALLTQVLNRFVEAGNADLFKRWAPSEIKLMRRIHGAGSMEFIESRISTAKRFVRLGQHSAASELFTQTIHLLRDIGTIKPKLAFTVLPRLHTYFFDNDLYGLATLSIELQLMITIRTETAGEHSPLLIPLFQGLAAAQRHLRDNAMAIANMINAKTITRIHYGESSDEHIQATKELAAFCRSVGELRQAQEFSFEAARLGEPQTTTPARATSTPVRAPAPVRPSGDAAVLGTQDGWIARLVEESPIADEDNN